MIKQAEAAPAVPSTRRLGLERQSSSELRFASGVHCLGYGSELRRIDYYTSMWIWRIDIEPLWRVVAAENRFPSGRGPFSELLWKAPMERLWREGWYTGRDILCAALLRDCVACPIARGREEGLSARHLITPVRVHYAPVQQRRSAVRCNRLLGALPSLRPV